MILCFPVHRHRRPSRMTNTKMKKICHRTSVGRSSIGSGTNNDDDDDDISIVLPLTEQTGHVSVGQFD